MGQYDKAIEIVGDAGRLDELIDVARVVDKKETAALRRCAEFFREHGHHQYAKVYLKMGDVQALMKLHVELRKWDDAFLLSKQHGGKFSEDVYLPYALWLAQNDRFDEAQAAFKRANKPEQSMKMLQELSSAAILEQRFEDAAYYLWLLSEEKMALIKREPDDMGNDELDVLDEALTKRELAQQYFAYGAIAQYTNDPFTTLEPETVFNTARFLLNSLPPAAGPAGISRAAALWAMGKQGENLGAYKLARFALDRLGHLRVPDAWVEQIDLQMLAIQAKPYSDREELLDICYRCSATNPLINSASIGDMCVQCAHPFVRSFRSFDLLPLVEFMPDVSLTDQEALRLLQSESARDDDGMNRGPEGKLPEQDEEGTGRGTAERWTNDDDDDGNTTDAFAKFMLSYEFTQPGQLYEPMIVPASVIKLTSISDVFVVKWKCRGRRWQFFKNIIPDVRITLCQQCNTFFNEEDLEIACLSNGGKCPFCRAALPEF